jgi:hypothetical protein
VIVYKFLAAGATGRFSVRRWPAPGSWLEVAGPLEACANGIHACRADALAYWLDDELWSVELDGEVVEEPKVLIARRGRLVEPVDRWPEAAPALGEACAGRVRALADRLPDDARIAELADEAAEPASSAREALLATYAAVVAAELAEPGGFDAERQWQSRWLASLLGLA